MSDPIIPASQSGKEQFSRMSSFANKMVNQDGSITTLSNNPIIPASEWGKDQFARMAPFANKMINPDGSVTTMDIGGGGGGTGRDGKSAYELAVQNGFVGTVDQWLASLVGEDGAPGPMGLTGKSAYEIAVENGFIGTEQEWLDSLVWHLTPEMHRTTFRGKNLGTSVTASQQLSIQNGSFNDLFVGDYWIINGITWRIVDINYWLNCGDVAFVDNHLVIMPDRILYTSSMNSTNTTTGGYVGSSMHTTNLNEAKTMINNAFGSLVKNHRQYFTNAVNNGKPVGIAWYDSTIYLPNEINMYGGYNFIPANDGLIIPTRQTIDKQQFSAFAIKPALIIGIPRGDQWLRDVVSDIRFALVGKAGISVFTSAIDNLGVRPCFAIG